MTHPIPTNTPGGAVLLPHFAEIHFVKYVAAGGTTQINKAIAAGLPNETIVSTDAIRGELYGDPTIQGDGRRVFAIAAERCEAALAEGRSVWRDGLHLDRRTRKEGIERAHAAGAAAVALLRESDLSYEQVVVRNRSRKEIVPDGGPEWPGVPNVLRSKFDAHANLTVTKLYEEGYDLVVVWNDTTEFLIPTTTGPDALTDTDGSPLELIVLGDIHGCWNTLVEHLASLGISTDGTGLNGRLLVSVGDVNDKGRWSVSCLRWALMMSRTGKLVWVKGNHERSLGNALARGTRPEEARFGLGSTIAQIDSEPDAQNLRATLAATLPRLPISIDRPDLVVAHAAMNRHLVGDRSKKAEGFVLYKREFFWNGPESQSFIHGHVDLDGVVDRYRDVQEDGTACGEVVNVDTGCFRGGALSSYNSATKETTSTPANPTDLADPQELERLHNEVREFMANQAAAAAAKAARRIANAPVRKS